MPLVNWHALEHYLCRLINEDRAPANWISARVFPNFMALSHDIDGADFVTSHLAKTEFSLEFGAKIGSLLLPGRFQNEAHRFNASLGKVIVSEFLGKTHYDTALYSTGFISEGLFEGSISKFILPTIGPTLKRCDMRAHIDVSFDHLRVSNLMSLLVFSYRPTDIRMLPYLAGLITYLASSSGKLRGFFDKFVDTKNFSYCFSLEISSDEVHFCIYYSGFTPGLEVLIPIMNDGHKKLSHICNVDNLPFEQKKLVPFLMKMSDQHVLLPVSIEFSLLSDEGCLTEGVINYQSECFLDMVLIRDIVRGNFFDTVFLNLLIRHGVDCIMRETKELYSVFNDIKAYLPPELIGYVEENLSIFIGKAVGERRKLFGSVLFDTNLYGSSDTIHNGYIFVGSSLQGLERISGSDFMQETLVELDVTK